MGEITELNEIITELNEAINALNDLWPLLKDDEKEKILMQKKDLNDRARELADKMLHEIPLELTKAINFLRLATRAAKEAKQSVDNVALRIEKVANTIENLTSALAVLVKI